MLESRAERSALGAAADVAVSSRRWLEFSESKNLTAESHEQKPNDPSTISAQEACFDFVPTRFIMATRPKSDAQESDPHNNQPYSAYRWTPWFLQYDNLQHSAKMVFLK